MMGLSDCCKSVSELLGQPFNKSDIHDKLDASCSNIGQPVGFWQAC